MKRSEDARVPYRRTRHSHPATQRSSITRGIDSLGKHKHHYVPRFYLRRFASDRVASDPRRINVYSISRKAIFRDASLRDQSYRRRFYGETDEVEDALATLEGQFAPVLEKICATGSLPAAVTEDHALLFRFVALQMMRTTKRAEELNDTIDQSMKIVANKAARLTDLDLNSVRFGVKHPALWSLSNFAMTAAYLDDLKIRILGGERDIQFITSDNPVFKYNLYCEGSGETGTVGAACAGLILFLPLSPERCLLFYDGKVYKVGHPSNIETIALEASDTRTINALQYLGANSNLYWSGQISSGYFAQIATQYGRAREGFGIRTAEFEEVGNQKNSLVRQHLNIPNLKLQLSFLSIRRNARRVPLLERGRKYRRELPVDPRDLPEFDKGDSESQGSTVFKRVADA